MKILAVDDEQLQLDKLSDSILEVVPDADLVKTRRASEALYLAEDMDFDVAFLDVQMRSMTGIELANLLKRINPHLNIVFVTAFNEFKADAMDLRASGYVTKPATADKIRQELQNLRYPVSKGDSGSSNNTSDRSVQDKASSLSDMFMNKLSPEKEKLIHVQCFGNFDVFDRNRRPIHFKRSKSKEMLAYLISKRGTRCTSREIATILYENVEYTTKIQDSFRHISSALIQSLKAIGAEKVILKDHQNYAIDTSLIDCDFYDFIDDNSSSNVVYTGEFMAQYSWAEVVNGYLDSNI